MGGGADMARDLLKCASALRRLAGVPSQASKGAAEGIRELVRAQFDEARDPYGNPWRPLAASTVKRKGSTQINVESGRTRDEAIVRPMAGAGVEVIFTTEYAQHIQKVRPIFPYAYLPREWDQAISTAVSAVRDRALDGSGASVGGADG